MKQTHNRRCLKGLTALTLRVRFVAEEWCGGFFPVRKSHLEKAAREILVNSGIRLVADAAVVLQIEVGSRFLTFTKNLVTTVRIETTLAEPVQITRNKLKTTVDTWRHRAVTGVFIGMPDPAEFRDRVEAEVLRQIEAFVADLAMVGSGPGSDTPEPADDRPSPPPDGSNGRAKDHKIKLGAIDGVPELKTEMETQCLGPICSDVPVAYTRTSKAVAYAVVSCPQELFDTTKKEIESCAMMAAGAVTIALIVAGPSAALPAFQATFGPCIESKLRERASAIKVTLKVEQEAGEWRRRT